MIFAFALMTVARRGADRPEYGGAVFVENAANRLLLADFAHFALALDRGVCRQRLDPELARVSATSSISAARRSPWTAIRSRL